MKFKPIKLAAIHSNEGLILEYQARIDRLLENMHNSLVYWIGAAYKAQPPMMAQDENPAEYLNKAVKRLGRRWTKQFNESAAEWGAHYARKNKERTDASLKAALLKAGFTVEFRPTPEIRDIMAAAVNQNVSLIKTIGAEHLSDVNEMVMRSVMKGRDLGGLREELEARYGISKRKASLIARQSNNDASAALLNARFAELGIENAQWVHSNAGKAPRQEHVRWHGQMYDIKAGKWSEVSKKFVWPGTDFNCRCTSRAIIKTQTIAMREL